MTLIMNNVVLAEDDPDISSMVKKYFERAYELSVATTDKVDKILPLVLNTNASVLIMDLELSDGDATQVLSDVADINGLIVIILTGTWKGREENKLLKDGAQVVMRKPQKPSTIWQQVLNLRGTNQRIKEKPDRIRVIGQKGYYDIQEGVIIEREGKITYLSDKKWDIMDILARRMVTDQAADSEIDITAGGWVLRKEMTKVLFGTAGFTKDIKNTFWYFLRKLKDTLEEWSNTSEEVEVIENRRVGRTESYYRLNPNIFELEKPDNTKGEG
jgi:DNA-binding response OmpR family regulator